MLVTWLRYGRQLWLKCHRRQKKSATAGNWEGVACSGKHPFVSNTLSARSTGVASALVEVEYLVKFDVKL